MGTATLKCASVKLRGRPGVTCHVPMLGRCSRRTDPASPRLTQNKPRREDTHLQVGEEPVVILEYGVHAVRHGDCVLPVVIRNPPVVLLYRHNEATQLFKLKAVRKRKRSLSTGTGNESIHSG